MPCTLCISGTILSLISGKFNRVTRPDGRLVLAFGPNEDEHAVAAFPASVYHFYAIEEAQHLLSKAGFGRVNMARETIGARDIDFRNG